jgi:hypothetical protein
MFARFVLPSVVLALFGFSGCAKPNAPPPATTEAAHEHEGHGHEGHTHGGWWCGEHGVPEEVCALCSPKLVADFKAKGDWCKEHERPDSQCFICHPEKEAEFAAQYEAKYGKKPPKPQS